MPTLDSSGPIVFARQKSWATPRSTWQITCSGPGKALEAANHPVQNLAAIPAMAYAAAVTSSIKIGCRVFCIDYHNPVVLTKSAMTIDMLSGGRLEFGLGAGWIKSEYEAVEYPLR